MLLLLVVAAAVGAAGKLITYGHPHLQQPTGFALFDAETQTFTRWTSEDQLLKARARVTSVSVGGSPRQLLVGGTFAYLGQDTVHHLLAMELQQQERRVFQPVSSTQGPWGYSVDAMAWLTDDSVAVIGPILGLSNDIGIEAGGTLQCSISNRICLNMESGLTQMNGVGAYEGLSSLASVDGPGGAKLLYAAYVTPQGAWQLSLFDVFSQTWGDVMPLAVYDPARKMQLVGVGTHLFMVYSGLLLRSALCEGVPATQGFIELVVKGVNRFDWCVQPVANMPFKSQILSVAEGQDMLYLFALSPLVFAFRPDSPENRVVDVTHNLREALGVLSARPLQLYAGDARPFVRVLDRGAYLENDRWVLLERSVPVEAMIAATDDELLYVTPSDHSESTFELHSVSIPNNATLNHESIMLPGLLAPAEVEVMCGSFADFVALGSIDFAGDVVVPGGAVLFDSLDRSWIPLNMTNYTRGGAKSCVTNSTDILLTYQAAGNQTLNVLCWSSDLRLWTLFSPAYSGPSAISAGSMLSPTVHGDTLFVCVGDSAILRWERTRSDLWEHFYQLPGGNVYDMHVVRDFLYVVGDFEVDGTADVLRIDVFSGLLVPMQGIQTTALSFAAGVTSGAPDGGEPLVFIGGRFALLSGGPNVTYLANNLAAQSLENGTWTSRVHNGLVRFELASGGISYDPVAQAVFTVSKPLAYVADLPCSHAFCFNLNMYMRGAWFPSETFLPAYKNTQAVAVLLDPGRHAWQGLLIVALVFALFVGAVSGVIILLWRTRSKRAFRYIQLPGFSDRSPATIVAALQQDTSIRKISRADLDIGEVVGRGGQGVVRKALYGSLVVAVKTMQLGSSVDWSYFAKEAALLSTMDHVNIIAFHGLLFEEGSVSLVLEYMETDVSQVLEQLDAQTKLAITSDLIDAMCYLHGFIPPVLHRDLKLANLLISREGTVKLSDFGISRLQSEETRQQMTLDIGTLMYMAPELWSTGVYDTAIDVYSFGLLQIELWTLERPYNDSPSSSGFMLEFMHRVQTRQVTPRVQDLPQSGCPASLCSIIGHCVQYEPAERPSFAEIKKRFEHY